MTRPLPPRLGPAVLLAALGVACGKDAPLFQPCQPPAPQPSALPTLPAAAGPGESQAIHLGVRATGETATFEVPAGTASVTIVEQAASPEVPLTVRAGFGWLDNTAVPLFVDVAGAGRIFADVPMPPEGAFPPTGALTVPNTSLAVPGTAPGAGVPAGTWTVTVGDWAHECRTFPALGCAAAA